MSTDKDTIRRAALDLIHEDGRRVAPRLASGFGLNRGVASGYLKSMADDGLIEASGSTRARVYQLAILTELKETYPREGLQEDLVCRELIVPVVARFPENVRDIWTYASTEMINNAIDHSGAPEVRVTVRKNALFTEVLVEDEGEGIFRKIQRAFQLQDSREAILELAKGKLTTDPDRHTGEGIFFTSRAVDLFEIESHHLLFSHAPRDDDSIERRTEDVPGTRVRMRLTNDSSRSMRELFDTYADPEEYTFDKTVVPLRLAQYEGEKLVSRSQAKRVASRFERFKRVELDFAGISYIGQAFADEMFRVFARAHPDIRIVPINTDPAVDQMIRRVLEPAPTSDTPEPKS